MIQIIILFQLLFGANVSSCFKSIEKNKYDEANQCFNNILDKDPNSIEALYGKAIVLSNRNFSNYDFDSAYFYIVTADKAYKLLNKKQQDQLFKTVKLSATKINYLRKNIAIDALGSIDRTNISELEKFISTYSAETLALRAQEFIDEIKIFSNIPLNEDITFYETLIKKYPTNDSINKIWDLYYKLYTADGSLLSYMKFNMNYPESPLKQQIENDYIIAKFAEQYKLLYRKTLNNEMFYDDFIKQAAPRRSALLALLAFQKDNIDLKHWQKVIEGLEKYKADFYGNEEFNSILALLKKSESVIIPESLGVNINTAGNEFSPIMNAVGNKLYFGGLNRADNIGGEDIFVSEFSDNKWQPANIVESISTKYGNEAPEALSIDESRMLLFSDGNILISNITDSGWSKPTLFPSINTREWEGDAMLTADGKAVIFASESWKKIGTQYPAQNRKDLFDIYISFKSDNGNWSAPLNLGTTINTPFCDRYPFLHPDMKTLYFSSEGHGGLGGTDVYKSERLYDTSWTYWSKPVNLGKNINTSGNDNGYKVSTDGTTAYFSIMKSNIDIYTIQLPDEMRPQPVVVVEGYIYDENNKPMEATIRVEDLTNGTIIGEYYSHPVTGNYTMTLPTGREYGYFVSKQFYFPVSKNINLIDVNECKNVKQDFIINSIKNLTETNTSVRINNIFFDTDKYDLKLQSYAELIRIAAFIKHYNNYQFEITGHTDNTGDSNYNLLLSQNRANAVMQFLIDNGCSKEKITAKGFGHTKPIVENTTESNKAKNRRVEIRIIK